jgi:shikimate kinase
MILKLKRTPGIYLVGFMGSGKSTVGRALADRLGWTFVDLDAEIERRESATINEIFDTRGEEEFRRAETAALREQVRAVERAQARVISLGGGAFEREENRILVANNGVSVWLDCPLEAIERRIAGNADRPLARDLRTFRELFQTRQAGYGKADYRISIASDDPAAAVAQILALGLF